MPVPAGNGEPSPQKDFLKFKDGRLSTNIRDRPLSQVAQALIEQVAVNVRIADSLRNARISAQILDQPLEQGLRDLFRQNDAYFLSVIDYLAFNNGRRSHSKLGYKTPLEFERYYYSKAA